MKKKDLPIDAKYIIKKLEEALKRFGTYSYYDKGPHEVIDTMAIAAELKKLTAKEAGEILKEVGKHERGELLRDCLASDMDDVKDEEWFEERIDISGAEY